MTLRTTRVRRTATRLTLAATALATVGLFGATGASFASAGAATRVSGAGVRSASSSGDVPFTFAFDAITKPAPSNGVYGTFSGSFPHDAPFPAPGNFATFQGVVTCLQVNGTKATIGGIITSGYGYDDLFDQGQRDLSGDWFITTVQDNSKRPGGSPLDTMGFNDFGDRAYFASQGFNSFASLCEDPSSDLGTAQFPLDSGDIAISGS
jgi:hypothetical protein